MIQMAEERISLTAASQRFAIPVPTLRSWLDKGWLTRHWERGRIQVDVAEVERILAERKRGER